MGRVVGGDDAPPSDLRGTTTARTNSPPLTIHQHTVATDGFHRERGGVAVRVGGACAGPATRAQGN